MQTEQDAQLSAARLSLRQNESRLGILARNAAFQYGGSVGQALRSWSKSGSVGAGSPGCLVKAPFGRSGHFP
jgi:hypothetical protein